MVIDQYMRYCLNQWMNISKHLLGNITETSLSADYIYMTLIPFSRSKWDLDIFSLNIFSITSGWKVIRLLCIYNYDMQN